MDAGRVLREARRRVGLTQRALAAKARVPQSMIARIESGAVTPRVDTLDGLLESCGEGLYARERMGVGVDITLIERMRALPAMERASSAAESSARYSHFFSNLSKPDGSMVREGRDVTDAGAVVETLQRHSVRFVIIGGVAANLQGAAVMTFDFDICYARDDENLIRLAAALNEMHAYLRGAPPGLPFILDERTLKNGDSFTFVTDFGDFDILATPSGTRGFEDLSANADEYGFFGSTIQAASVGDLLRMKRAAGRAKDTPYIEQLGALQEVLDDAARARRAKGKKKRRDG